MLRHAMVTPLLRRQAASQATRTLATVPTVKNYIHGQ